MLRTMFLLTENRKSPHAAVCIRRAVLERAPAPEFQCSFGALVFDLRIFSVRAPPLQRSAVPNVEISERGGGDGQEHVSQTVVLTYCEAISFISRESHVEVIHAGEPLREVVFAVLAGRQGHWIRVCGRGE